MEKGGEIEKTWDIKGNLGWENENRIKGVGVDAGMCITAFMKNTLQTNKQKKEKQNVCLRQAQRESGWMEPSDLF